MINGIFQKAVASERSGKSKKYLRCASKLDSQLQFSSRPSYSIQFFVLGIDFSDFIGIHGELIDISNSRKLEEAQLQISKLQAANEEWSRRQSAEIADLEELKAHFIECANVLQEQMKFNAELVVEKHRLERAMGEKIASEESLRKSVAVLEVDVARARRTISELKQNSKALEENLRETRSEANMHPLIPSLMTITGRSLRAVEFIRCRTHWKAHYSWLRRND